MPQAHRVLQLGRIGELFHELTEDFVAQFRSFQAVRNDALNRQIHLIRLQIAFHKFAQILERKFSFLQQDRFFLYRHFENAARYVDVFRVVHVNERRGQSRRFRISDHFILRYSFLQKNNLPSFSHTTYVCFFLLPL